MEILNAENKLDLIIRAIIGLKKDIQGVVCSQEKLRQENHRIEAKLNKLLQIKEKVKEQRNAVNYWEPATTAEEFEQFEEILEDSKFCADLIASLPSPDSDDLQLLRRFMDSSLTLEFNLSGRKTRSGKLQKALQKTKLYMKILKRKHFPKASHQNHITISPCFSLGNQ